MTVAELIEELRKHPAHARVNVAQREVFFADENGEGMINCCEEDSLEADEVRNEGPFVLIWGGKPC